MHGQDMPDNPRAVQGDNNPPVSAIENSRIAFQQASEFMKSVPVVQSDDEARSAKVIHDTLKGALDTMESERDGRVRPLNEKVREINGEYRGTRETIEKLLDELKVRINAFIEAERVRREAIAAEAQRRAEEAERLAREKEAAETEAKENATVGECADVGEAIAEADSAFDTYQREKRAALRAERDTNVRIGGGGTRALAQRTSETLTIDDPAKAIREIVKLRGEIPEKLADAIRSAARDYRKAKGRLPAGITSSTSRSV